MVSRVTVVSSREQKDFWHRNLSVGHIGLKTMDRCYFRNGESNPGLQGENLLS